MSKLLDVPACVALLLDGRCPVHKITLRDPKTKAFISGKYRCVLAAGHPGRWHRFEGFIYLPDGSVIYPKV